MKPVWRKTMRRLMIGFILVLVFSFAAAALALADSGGVPLAQQPPLPVGTVITIQNWQQYKDYMPMYMQILFSGQYAYKLTPSQQVVVGPTLVKPYPKEYAKNTEKYGGQTGLKVLDDGGTVIQNYTAGQPFPHPTNPNIADKILWDLWYRYLPRVEINKVINSLLVDKYHQIFRQILFNDYMRLSHVSEPGLPIYTPEAKDIDIALYLEVTEPEQSKYTVSLIIYFTDTTRIQEIWSFVPSLRRPLRLSASARCAPAAGTDSTTEDQKSGFNMLLSETYGTLVGHKMLLMSNNLNSDYPSVIDLADTNTVHQWGIDTGAPWPPAPAKWELGETWVVEARRVKEKLAGYCYGNRRMNIDARDYHLPGQELYDMGNKLWKIEMLFSRLHPNGYGDMFETGSGNYVSSVMDLQNVHLSAGDELNGTNYANTDVDPALWSVARYGSPTGLLEIMK
jgi:Protein of unknown function (DUF1329)